MYVQCLGAAGRVTGSCHLVQAGDFRILLDCGLIQGRRRDEELNFLPFPFDVGRIDMVVDMNRRHSLFFVSVVNAY